MAHKKLVRISYDRWLTIYQENRISSPAWYMFRFEDEGLYKAGAILSSAAAVVTAAGYAITRGVGNDSDRSS